MPVPYYEYKYLVPHDGLSYVTKLLESTHGGSDPFGEGIVDSIYFDSPEQACFHECRNGDLIKRKFRIRTYGDDLFTSLQLKEKRMQAVFKTKCAIEPKMVSGRSGPLEWHELFPAAGGGNQSGFDEIMNVGSSYGRLAPAVRIRYMRRRYRAYDHRMTLDYNIEVMSCGGNWQFRHDFGMLPHHVLEIKTRDLRPHLPFLGLLKLPQVSFSKFYLGVQLMSGSYETSGYTDLTYAYQN